MKLDSKKSKAAVKNSAVQQKKVKAKAANPAKAPKVKKTLNTKKAQKVNNKPKVKGKKKLSTKLILIPVFVVGFVSVISSGLSLKNLSKVNDAASQIVDTSMVGTEMLNDIEMETVNIHTLALAHIISTDLSSMIDIVSEVRNHEEKLKQLLDDYNPYVTLETKRNYRIICENYTSLVKECGNVMAFSAADTGNILPPVKTRKRIKRQMALLQNILITLKKLFRQCVSMSILLHRRRERASKVLIAHLLSHVHLLLQ